MLHKMRQPLTSRGIVTATYVDAKSYVIHSRTRSVGMDHPQTVRQTQ